MFGIPKLLQLTVWKYLSRSGDKAITWTNMFCMKKNDILKNEKVNYIQDN